MTRKDSPFDALGTWENDRVGIGLKTWIHARDSTYKKIAKFNKLTPEFIAPLIENGTPKQVIKKISEFRNERIMLDKRLHKTNRGVYHYITRYDDDVISIVETPYDLIDIDSLEFINSNGKSYNFIK